MDATLSYFSFQRQTVGQHVGSHLSQPERCKNVLLISTISSLAGVIFLLLGAIYSASALLAAAWLLYSLGTTALITTLYFQHAEAPISQGHLRSLQKMIANSRKAAMEHFEKEPKAYALPEHAVPTECAFSQQPQAKLQFSHFVCEKQGQRDAMEDANFFTTIPTGILIGILDGHGGQQVASYVADKFARRFTKQLTKHHGDPYQAFTAAIDKLQARISTNEEWLLVGSTAAIAYVDQMNRIYTATLGDSEINIYRKDPAGSWQSIALSCVRDWRSPTDALRASIALNDPKVAYQWPERKFKPRFPNNHFGVNVSRALGDVAYGSWPPNFEPGRQSHPGVIHKAKISVNCLLPGDIVVAACDGLKDFALETEILAQVAEHEGYFDSLAKDLVDYALERKNSSDNVTTLVVHVS
jgi:serine/threonine protein phosphatase PrpC